MALRMRYLRDTCVSMVVQSARNSNLKSLQRNFKPLGSKLVTAFGFSARASLCPYNRRNKRQYIGG